MTRYEEASLLRAFAFAVLLCGVLAAASRAAAQGQEVVYSVSPNEAWPKSTRVDGKLPASAFSFLVKGAGTGAAARPSAQDAAMTIPAGEHAALWMRAATMGRHLNFVLIEFPLTGQKAGSRAPFAIRLSEVFVTSVQVAGSQGGQPLAQVTMSASKLEVFTASQDATGAMKQGPQFNWDFKKQSMF